MGPDVFNKETGVFSVYRLDYSMDVGPAVSLLRYAKGDGVCRIMRLNFYLNHQANLIVEWCPPCRLGPSSLAALGHEADVMREY